MIQRNHQTCGLKPHIVPVLLLMAAVFAIYAQSLGHDFISNWDDQKYIIFNEAAKGFSFGHIKAAFSSYYVGNYAPLHIISYMLDYSLWGMRAAGFIFTNILLHALNGLLYYALLIKLTGNRAWAFLAGFIFLLHPVQVESVAWISQRKNVLAMFFFLVSFLLFIGYRESGFGNANLELASQNSESKTQNSKFLYAGSVAAFLCALLVKSVAVILPPVLMFYDLCLVSREKRGKWLIDKVPFIAVAAIIALIAMKSQAPEFEGGRTGYHGGSPLATIFTMLPVFVRYLGMLLWPAELSIFYNPPVRTGVDVAVVLSALLLTGLCVGGFFLYRRRRELFFWGTLFFIGLIPVSQIVPLVTLMNDRYLYFPMLGAAAFMVGAAVSALDALGGAGRKAATTGLCLVLLALPFMSFKRAQVWQNALTLWSDAYSRYPDSPLVCSALGYAYYEGGRPDLALPLYMQALSLNPLDRESLDKISVLYLESGELEKAEKYLITLVLNYPEYAEGFVTLGHYYFLAGNLQKGEAACRKALMLQPRSPSVLSYLGQINLERHQIETARKFFLQAFDYGCETADLHYYMASLEAASGRNKEALEHMEKAFKLGYKDRNAIQKNRNLDSLRDLPEFQRLLAESLSIR